MSKRYALSDIVERTGAKRRTIQFWADSGVLVSVAGTDRAGTGTHRLFEIWEVQVAALVLPLADMRISIGVLRRFAEVMREGLWYLQGGAGAYARDNRIHDISSVLRRALNRDGRNYMLFAFTDDELLIDVASDEDGQAICIDPEQSFPQIARDRNPIVILNLSAILGPLLE